ncbi:MAG: lytic transglycosylase domain-containing protein [Spirochaetota bacterium]
MKFRTVLNSAAAALILLALILVLGTCSQGGHSLGWYRDFGPEMERELLRLSSLRAEEIPAYLKAFGDEDKLALMASSEQGKARVEEFFADITGSKVVGDAILENSLKYGVSPALSLALAFEESRFNPTAINHNASSIDRGLFQLNSLAFPKVGIEAAYDPRVNAKNGISHLAWFFKVSRNEVAALAMYNAGRNKVEGLGTPRRTLDYIYRIQSYRDNVMELFSARVAIRDSSKLSLTTFGSKTD